MGPTVQTKPADSEGTWGLGGVGKEVTLRQSTQRSDTHTFTFTDSDSLSFTHSNYLVHLLFFFLYKVLGSQVITYHMPMEV